MASVKNLYGLLRARYPENEYVLMQEVSDSNLRNRSLDYMAVNMWQSRGFAITGIEVKSGRGDWLRELKNPKKQESHFQYCDYFYLLTTDDKVAKLEEIPDTWGWLCVRGSKIVTIKPAPKLKPIPVPKTFLCCMLRRAASKDGFIHKDSIQERIDAEVESATQRLTQNHIWKSTAYDELIKTVQQFESTAGIKIESWKYTVPKIGEVVNFVLNNDIDTILEKVQGLIDSLSKIHSSTSLQIQKVKDEYQSRKEKVGSGAGDPELPQPIQTQAQA